MQDVLPPATKPAMNADPEIKPVFTEDVPVRQPAAHAGFSDAATNPIAGANPSDQPATEEEMDKILDDVSQKIKSNPGHEKVGFLARLKGAQGANPPARDPSSGSRPVLVAAVAVVVGLSLMALAYFAFNSDEQAKQTAAIDSTQEPADNSSVTPADMDELSEGIQSEIDGLNDNQDFDSASLSDSALGL